MLKMKIVNESKKLTSRGADQAELSSLKHDAFTNAVWSDDQIRALQSRYLIKKAERYILPIPPFDKPPFDKKGGNWKQSDVTPGRWWLTLPAQAELRSAIDDYEKGRCERIQRWVMIMSGIIVASTGLLGALIGLIAISS